MTVSIDSIDERREFISQQTPTKRKSELGQFMTPSVIGRFMSSMFRPLKGKSVVLLDPGCGIGSLTTEFVRRGVSEGVQSLECELWEIDSDLVPELKTTLRGCQELCDSSKVKFRSVLRTDDFILSQNDLFMTRSGSRFTHSILNPPYKKINSNSSYRSVLRSVGIESSNLYSGFVSLSIELLEDGGELVGITPRSFCNGPYFRPFRELILKKTSITRVHLFGSRTDPFKGDDVLQENVIFHLVKGESQGDVVVSSSSDSSFSDLQERTVPFHEFCVPQDPESIFHLVTEEDDDEEMRSMMKEYSHTLTDIGLSVSTGPVVDFRLRSSLREKETRKSVPLFYSFHFDKGRVRHPVESPKKPQFIEVNEETSKWLSPRGNYVLIRRLSSKEEKRRVVPGVLFKTETDGEFVGLENHLNFIHEKKKGLPKSLCVGLSIYLGSTFVDRWIRRFSGHTQVNSSDLRSLGFPSREVLTEWGVKYPNISMSQEEIDSIVHRGSK